MNPSHCRDPAPAPPAVQAGHRLLPGEEQTGDPDSSSLGAGKTHFFVLVGIIGALTKMHFSPFCLIGKNSAVTGALTPP